MQSGADEQRVMDQDTKGAAAPWRKVAQNIPSKWWHYAYTRAYKMEPNKQVRRVSQAPPIATTTISPFVATWGI